MTLPTQYTPGYGLYVVRTASGTTRSLVACDCLRSWLPVLTKYLNWMGYTKHNPLWIEQLTGGEPDSAGTHTQGGVFDLGYSNYDIAMTCREMGAPATWIRYRPTFDIDHTHGVLSNCPHNTPARYQITEQWNGGDGLIGTRPDPLPDPKIYRTWSEGRTWALGRMNPTAFMISILKFGKSDFEIKQFQQWLWSKQPDVYKNWFRVNVYNFDTKGFTDYYGNATRRMVADTYKRLHTLYPTEGWDYGVVNNVWPDEPGPRFVTKLGGTTYK